MQELFKCVVCGGSAQYISTLKYKRNICMNCISRLSVLHPFEYTTENNTTKTVCPLDDISPEQLKGEFEKARECREELIRKYDYKYAVFEVKAVKTIKGGFLQADYLNVYGRPLYGDFHIFDEVTISHSGGTTSARIDAICDDAITYAFHELGAKQIKQAELDGLTCTTASEGGAYVLAFKKGSFDVAERDIIFK